MERVLSRGNFLFLNYYLFFRADGRTYVGEFQNDKKHGYGVYTWADGRMYKGGWNAGKQHGEGVFIDAQQKEKKGEWNMGDVVRWI